MGYTAPGRCPRCNGHMYRDVDEDLRRPVSTCLQCGYQSDGAITVSTYAKPEPNAARTAHATVADPAVSDFASAAQTCLDLAVRVREAEQMVVSLKERLDAAHADLETRRTALEAKLAGAGLIQPPAAAPAPRQRRHRNLSPEQLDQLARMRAARAQKRADAKAEREAAIQAQDAVLEPDLADVV